MKAAPFHYVRPATVAEAVAALADGAEMEGGAKLIAGGQSLVPLLAMRLAAPSLLVDLNGVDELVTIRHSGPHSAGPPTVTVGAMVRHRDLAQLVGDPLLATAAGWIGHTAIRNRGTIGGSLAHADPNAEWPMVALACDAAITAVGPQGERPIPADRFFLGLLQTALADDEILTGVTLARPRRWGFAELARRHGDFALVAAAVTELDQGWRVALAGVAGTPVRCAEAEALLAAGERDPAAVAAAVAASPVAAAFTDLHASAAYRRAMAAELTARAVAEAFDRPGRAP